MSLDLPEGKVSLRPMTLVDLDQVIAIDRVSFPTSWPKDAFRYELERNRNSLCWVAERTTPEQPTEIIASIVIWKVLDEAHITTLAIKPGFRRYGGWAVFARPSVVVMRSTRFEAGVARNPGK